MSPTPRIGLTLGPGDDFRAAATPLFEAGLVDALEWTLDATWGFGVTKMPPWVDSVLDLYANAGRLYGHGVTFSALSGRWEHRQEKWLERAQRELRRRRYVHVTEHFGFMCARGFLPSAPLPVPRTDGSLRVGRHAIQRLSDAVGAPVGLENLASIFGPRDVADQAGFLEDLVTPTGGFLILDLHNLYCQAVNLDVPLQSLIDTYPLTLVREVHIAGGRVWRSSDEPERTQHTDSHDAAVPTEVFEMLPYVLGRCPGVEVVILERFFGTLATTAAVEGFQADFRKLRATALGEELAA